MLSFSNVRIGISIHAPRGGSDNRRPKYPAEPQDFNPRSPWGERLQDGWLVCPICNRFQSTLPVGGATGPNSIHDLLKNISIHAPRGGSDPVHLLHRLRLRISIHAPRGGSDEEREEAFRQFDDFNPRSPWGERLPLGLHALRSLRNFNPRSPWGERPAEHDLENKSTRISIHAPRGGSDSGRWRWPAHGGISIHAPRGGSDALGFPDPAFP